MNGTDTVACGREEGVLIIDRIMSVPSDFSCKRGVQIIHAEIWQPDIKEPIQVN